MSDFRVMRRFRSLYATDEELGPVRYCRRCDEWWPMDAAFWVIVRRPAGTWNTAHGRRYQLKSIVTGYHCRGCWREQQAA